MLNKEIINDIIKNSDYEIIFCGHSLGGAVATIALNDYLKLNLKNNMILMTFVQPRVGDYNFTINLSNKATKIF